MNVNSSYFLIYVGSVKIYLVKKVKKNGKLGGVPFFNSSDYG